MPKFAAYFCNSIVFVLVCHCACAQEIPHQSSGPSTLLPQGAAPTTVRKVAVSGQPFGVLSVEVPLPPEFQQRDFDKQPPRVLVSDESGRVFYPVTKIQTAEIVEQEIPAPSGRRIGRPGGLIDRVRSAIRTRGPKRTVPVAVSITALYRTDDAGERPVDLVLSGDLSQTIRIEPSAIGADYRQLLKAWWTDYVSAAKEDLAGDDFPKLVHKYLVSMLARRLGLPNEDLDPPKNDESEPNQTLETLALLAAIEPLREEILENVLTFESDSSEATLPVPLEPAWEPTIVPPLQEAPQIEALASRVPPECFYLRFGSFSNYVWFQDIAERYGGDIAQAVLLRGFNYEASAKMERMLAAKMTQIAKMFGDKLIGDMAVIGTDLYMKEGASLGVVFYAKNVALLNAAIESDRKAIASKTPGARVQKLRIQGKEVILLSTPDNRVRSFYVSDGPYVCVTTSQRIVERFLEVGNGAPSLASTAYFQSARSWMPDANDYSVFAFFSPEFFHHLVSPKYQIELRRRLEAIAHLEVAELASRAALSEGIPQDDLRGMQQVGLVPPWFNRRVDGAQAIRDGDHWVDSLRGARGSFLPIADTPITGVSQREVEEYTKVANYYLEEWKHMDPMIFGLRRFQADDGTAREKVAFEGYIAPFEAEKYGWVAKMLAEPSPMEIQQPVDDAASLQAHMRGNNYIGPKSDNYILFAGLKDMIPPSPEQTQGLFKTLQSLKAAPAYLGAWPKPYIIEQLPLGIGRQLSNPDFAGFSRMIGGLWRWQDASFSLLSFNRGILENAITQVSAAESSDLAQARLKVATLKGSQLADWINGVWYQRGWQSSQGNVKLLDVVHQQLRVPGDECMDIAQRLLDVKLQCPLGGQYEFVEVPTGTGGWWRSTALVEPTVDAAGRVSAPANYEAPWVDWFRGGRVHLTQGSNSVALIGDIDLEMKPLSVKINEDEPTMLPKLNFDLFSLPKSIFGGAESKTPKGPERKSF